MKQAVREAKALQGHKHPFIVRLEGIFHTTIFYGILLEFCDNDLNKVVIDHGTKTAPGAASLPGLPAELAARYGACIMLALEFLHGRKVIFRDLKPENVLVTSCERGNHAKLTDFGLARTIDTEDTGPASKSSTRVTLKAGTMAFMSAQAIGATENNTQNYKFSDYAAVDWYGLGCCLVLMLLGEAGGTRLMRGRRDVLLPAPQDEIFKRLSDAMDEEVIDEDAFDIATENTKDNRTGNSDVYDMRSNAFIQQALSELEEEIEEAVRATAAAENAIQQDAATVDVSP
jgi:serine/threonine protein kinase